MFYEDPENGQSREVKQPHNDKNCQIMIDNSDNILKTLKTLWQDQSMCDVYLKVGGKQYGAHRFILSSNSDVFQAMLMNSAWSEWKESHIELQELPICESVFQAFLEYFYTGKILITHTNVVPILALADKYLVKGLQRNCITYMSYHVPHAAYHNQLSPWLQYSYICNHEETLTSCKNFFKWNFEAVAKTTDYGNVDCDIFIKIISSDDVVVHNEMMLYHCVVRWLDLQRAKVNKSAKEYKELVEMVMMNIRFPMMTPRELAELLISPLIKQHEQFFVDRMAIGMKYHSGFEDQLERHYVEERHLFIPRLYTSDSRSAVLNIDNFWDLQSYHVSTFVFSSLLSAAEHDSHKISEWEVKLYPKGVHFKKCYLICWQGTMEVPEEILKTVRLSLTCGESANANVRVKVSVLIYGIQGGVEHVMQIIEKSHYFNAQSNILNMDDLIPFHVLNPGASLDPTYENPYLIGPNKNQLKLTIVIAPIQ
ncbi:BTB/POZ domain-containing protein 17 [Anthonomus grandis grandis]|uniref:BTB/POZ domain-containing protein 17 n=1 Tax=Anthonomus grandis grandis TaxID=2921223 RepID=UPI002165470A|nr:BTB/POZ domain-containing protein 17 [Anthonomus grandis grandis]XP_050297219.1 BTB/POZ domain-containing protein 17 [Anthonomus grandis grandis]